jgi:hypothetical protein
MQRALRAIDRGARQIQRGLVGIQRARGSLGVHPHQFLPGAQPRLGRIGHRNHRAIGHQRYLAIAVQIAAQIERGVMSPRSTRAV